MSLHRARPSTASRPTRRRSVTLAAVFALFVLIATACGGSSNKSAPRTTSHAGSKSTSESSPKSTSSDGDEKAKPPAHGHSATTGADHEDNETKPTDKASDGKDSENDHDEDDDEDEGDEQNHDPLPVRLYFVHGSGLAAVSRGVAAAAAPDAIAALLTGPSAADRALGDSTMIPTGTTLRGSALSGNTLTVNLSSSFARAASATQMRERVAQVVFTATQFAGVTAVAFHIEGQAVSKIGAIAVSPPPTRQDLTAALDTVLTEVPAPYDDVNSPMFVLGMSDTFEGTVGVRLLDGHGHVLASTTAEASSGNGVWGTFNAKLTFAKPSTATGTLQVFDPSEGDGTSSHGQSIPIRFG